MANPVLATNSTGHLDAVVRNAIAQHQPVADSGVAIAVVKDGTSWFEAGYGLRERNARSLVTPASTFGLGSVTKPFTALAWTLWENETGTALLDQPIAALAAGFELKDPQVTKDVTLRDVLAHRTGLPRHDVLWYLGGFPMSDLVARLRHLPPARLERFRKSGTYNNLMYTAAGWLLEQESGEDWAAFLQKRLLDPLEMTATTFTIEALQSAAEYAPPYIGAQAMRPKDVTNIAPAGALNSTVRDVARFLEFLLKEGVLEDGRPLLPAEMTRRHFDPITEIDWRGVKQHYGLGWFVATVGGHTIVHHTGATDGYSAILAMVPAEGLGVCVLTNQHASLLPDRVAGAVIDALLGGAFSKRAFNAAQSGGSLGLGDFASALLETAPSLEGDDGGDYTGTYRDPAYGDMVISNARGRRSLQWGNNRWPLRRLPLLPFFWFRIEGYGRSQTVPIWIRGEPGGGRSFALPLEPEADEIRFHRT